MEQAAETDLSDRLPLETLEEMFEERSVSVAICYGSQAKGQTHDHSDIDLAVEFIDLRPGDEGYNDAFFGLFADVTETLGTDDVDLVDVHSLSGSLARAVFETGVLICGHPERIAALREELDTAPDERSPRKRLDEAIERMDEYLA